MYPVTLPQYLHFALSAVTTACWQECSVNCEMSVGVSHWVPGSKQQQHVDKYQNYAVNLDSKKPVTQKG